MPHVSPIIVLTKPEMLFARIITTEQLNQSAHSTAALETVIRSNVYGRIALAKAFGLNPWRIYKQGCWQEHKEYRDIELFHTISRHSTMIKSGRYHALTRCVSFTCGSDKPTPDWSGVVVFHGWLPARMAGRFGYQHCNGYSKVNHQVLNPMNSLKGFKHG